MKTNPKMVELEQLLKTNPKIKAKEVVRLLPDDFFEGKEKSSKVIYASTALTWIR